MPKSKGFRLNEFMSSLKQQQAAEPLAFDGMLKEGDSPDTLMFAFGMRCDNWVEIPEELVENAEFIRNVPCKDHGHPLVRLFLKKPSSSEGQFFAKLGQAYAAAVTMQRGQAGDSGRFPHLQSRLRGAQNPPVGKLPLGAPVPKDGVLCGQSEFSGVCASGCQCLFFGQPAFICCDAACCP